MIKISLCGVMAKPLDCPLVVNVLELESHYSIHFRINTLNKSANSFITSAMSEIVLILFYEDRFQIK